MNPILILSIICIFILSAIWIANRIKLQNIIKELTNRITLGIEERAKLSQEINALQLKVIALNKYQGLIDIEAKANEILAEAEKTANSIIDNAIKQLNVAEKEANEIKARAIKELEESNISAKQIKEKANLDAINVKQNAFNLLDSATNEAKLIISQAEKKALDIAGDAYKSMQNATELERTVKAMKNIIEGYGDQYLKPTYSLLDDLAEEFGHTEAGEKLKLARDITYLMVSNGSAAKCDYVENNRKETAIKFILDAFNGKVDSILSKVKKDNHGTLEQKIKDAYQVVNNNGKAFRNAVITKEYLNARIEELKWAVITQELKWKEQEEQRRIKEQIREEEKARREFEKAMREAQKEEETLKKLIEKAQKEVELASEAQKSKYEEKLRELESKLQIAEDKNQRALSMAQQTKSGNVYIISNIGSFGENVYKIGMTRRLEPLDRIKELGDASVPFEFDVHAMIFSENAPALETELHKRFMRLQMNKVNPRKEFFKVTLASIKDEVEGLNITAKWTMTAEARQYRESLAIEEAILNDKEKQLEWEKYQLQEAAAEQVLEEEIIS